MREVSFATYMAYLDHIAKRYVENRFFGKMALGGQKGGDMGCFQAVSI